MTPPIILALDTADLDRAEALASGTAPAVGMMKLGLEFFLAHGGAGVARVAARSRRPVFLDLKLHDIPNTVAGAVRAVLPLSPRFLTIHAAGGAAMIAAARRAAEAAGSERPMLLAVTVLTSLGPVDLAATGIADGPTEQALRLAELALSAGADGVVCSPVEVAPLRRAFGRTPLLVVPGIRPEGAASNDQVRHLPPRAAIAAGADWLVVGRPITGAADPAAAAAALASELA